MPRERRGATAFEGELAGPFSERYRAFGLLFYAIEAWQAFGRELNRPFVKGCQAFALVIRAVLCWAMGPGLGPCSREVRSERGVLFKAAAVLPVFVFVFVFPPVTLLVVLIVQNGIKCRIYLFLCSSLLPLFRMTSSV